MSTAIADRPTVCRLFERASLSAGRVDETTGIISNVKILGPVSKNGRRYSRQALENAVPKYEGVKVNVDHPGRANGERSYRDRIGVLRNVRYVEGSLRGDLCLNLKHPVTPQLLWDAKNSPMSVGLSHNASGRTRPGKDGVIVEEILDVLSVDVVSDPATTGGLFESYRGSLHTMTSSEFAAALFESDGGSTEPVTPAEPSSGDVGQDRELVVLQRVALEIIEKSKTADELLRKLGNLVDARRSVSAGSELVAAESMSFDAAEFASCLTEGTAGGSRPSGRDSAAAFAAALFD